MPDAEPATVCQLHRPAGTSARTPWSLEITQAGANWSWSSLRVLSLSAGGSHVFDTGDDEVLVLPLAGSCVLACGDVEYTLSGRAGVFEGATDFCYAPPAPPCASPPGVVAASLSRERRRWHSCLLGTKQPTKYPWRRGAPATVRDGSSTTACRPRSKPND